MPEKVVDKVDFRQAFEFPKKPEPKKLKQWFYDTRTNEYMGRTPKSWCKYSSFSGGLWNKNGMYG